MKGDRNQAAAREFSERDECQKENQLGSSQSSELKSQLVSAGTKKMVPGVLKLALKMKRER